MTAAYRDIKADMMRRITTGEWPPGGQLPSELELAQIYGAARATVSRAMRELVEDGIVERRRKAGTRVRMSPLRKVRFEIPLVRREIEEQGAVYRYALVRSEVCATPDWLRARLGLPQRGEVRHLVCLHFADGQPYQLECRWINLCATPDARAEDFTSTGPNEWLVAQVPFSTVQISFAATPADDEQAELLGCARGDALFEAERSTYWDGKAVTLVRLIYRRGYRMTTQY